MEKTLDLKSPELMDLGREELKKVDGGVGSIGYAFSIAGRALNRMVDDFMQGFVNGFKDHDYQPE